MLFRKGMTKIVVLFSVLSAFLIVPTFCYRIRAEEIAALKTAPEDILALYGAHPEAYKQAVEAGAKIVNLREYDTFFVYWLPDNFETLPDKTILVILHGNNGNAYRSLLDFCAAGSTEKVGIISIQWGWPRKEFKDAKKERIKRWERNYQYLAPDKVYEVMSIAIEYMGFHHHIDKYHSAWYGFDRSVGESVLYAFYDSYTENNYFKLFIASSGTIDSDQPLMKELNNGDYGTKPIEGKHFYLWSGTYDGDMSKAMAASKEIIERLGGSVHAFRIAPEGHDGFNRVEKYQLEAIERWKRI